MSNDITNDFVDRLKTNGKTCEGVRIAETVVGAGGGVAGSAGSAFARYMWFYYKVRNKGDWDFKNNVYKPYKASGVTVCGNHYGNDMPGNFHFGFAGRAAGFDTETLRFLAGWAQQRAGTSKPEFNCTY